MLFKSITSVSTSAVKRSLCRTLSSGYLHNPGSEPLTYATFGQVVEASAHRYPGRVAVRSIYENVTLTYEQLLTKADALGCAFRAQGLKKGDMIGIWSHNNAAWIVTLVAAARAGLISVLLNPVYEKPELSFCIKKTELKAIVIGDTIEKRNYYKLIEELIPEIHKDKAGSIGSKEFPSLKTVITCDKEALPGTFTFDSLVVNKGDASQFNAEVGPDDGAVIHLTSGTTGDPKAALDAHFGYINNSYFIGKRQNLHEGHQTICVQAPLFHAMGSVITTGAALRYGSTLVLASPTYNVDMHLRALLEEKCTVINGTPTMFVDIISLLRNKGGEPRLRCALSGGAPCSPQLIKDIKQTLNAEVVASLFGLSETTAAVFQSLPEDITELVADTVGYIHDHVEAKVVDDEGKMVPFGGTGELMVRGYCNMISYYGDPKKTRETLREDGWLYTGDKFTLSEDGYGRIVGRLKDIIVRGGENIAPKEIEDLLNTHPDVVESQVVGVSDERLGEELCAVVRLRNGASLTPKDVQRHCAGRLAKFKIPRMLKIAEEFPKTNSDELFLYARNHRVGYENSQIIKLTSFNVRIVSIYDPDDIEKILSSTRFIEKYRPYTFLVPWLGEGLLVSNGQKWHQRRKLLTSAFHFNILKQFSYTIIDQTEELMNRIQAEVGNSKTDLEPIITRATLRIMCETSMGTSMLEGPSSNKYFKAIHTIGHCVINRMIRPWIYPDWLFRYTAISKLQNSAIKYLHSYTDRIIQERKICKNNSKINGDHDERGLKNQRALLDLLLEKEKHNKIDDHGIREEVDTFMFEGHDTTAMALCFMIMRIANEPMIQDAIYTELKRVFCETRRPVTYEDLKEMKYLECCIKESLRIYPSVPFIARELTEDVTLGGYLVPAGTSCQIHVFDIHRLEDVYPEPEKFIPERFINDRRHPYAYIPFSAGPRNCIGMKFAMMELKVVMSSLLRRFRVEPVTRPEEVRYTGDLVLRAKHPLFVRFVPRETTKPYAAL